MKRTGIIILVAGLLITIFTGFNFITRKKVVDLGSVEIMKNENHNLAWSPLAGIAVMVVGGIVLLVGVKNTKSS